MTKVLAAYGALIAAGELRPDAEQRAAAIRLDTLATELEAPKKAGLFARLTGRGGTVPRGVYMFGDVGRGKSMLMDLFFANVAVDRKRRVHFSEFMLEVHGRIAIERRKESGDPIAPVAAALAEETRLLAFDEMMVTNSPDAMILSRLFTALIEAGVTMVTTSNRAPGDLYKNGLNREHFLPFIALIEGRLDVVTLNGPIDYRRDRLGQQNTWLVPNGPEATANLSAAFFRLTDHEVTEPIPSEDLAVQGRTLHVPKTLKGVAVFSFKKLCGEARGAADYLAIARRYHTVILVGIPQLGPENRNEAARFVQLIDALYEHKVKLLAAADAEPDALYPEGDGRFEFQRTVSRLEEMRSETYLAQGHGAI
ncbi:cell division protein ZapE [Sphingomonas aquatilis]|uniref:Cell division protein ZapE n=1 Tax=Sphingomonas aquatilis TaxID=93063 RepID=A0AAW3TXV4_9SPHN|nr:cell division protein ZapE [Sphingomonas aquatilis]MBB3876589.1 cell division protein ZapE [Sphingomonas aquatilis]MCI4652649.1 cell division protein ZapE [Sphingomonas aquatilis]GEM71443.1 cell division protein ZapE [Sphingomonas aquatilis NBRC 16722]